MDLRFLLALEDVDEQGRDAECCCRGGHGDDHHAERRSSASRIQTFLLILLIGI